MMMMKDQEVEDIRNLYINSDDGGVKEVHSKILETKVTISVTGSELSVVCIDDDCEVFSGPKG